MVVDSFAAVRYYETMKTNPLEYFLYRLVFPNGKLYFGITNNPKRRFAEHERAANKGLRPLYKAWRKHGAPLFEVLCKGCKKDICDAEIEHIAKFKTQDLKFGYNMSSGGEASSLGCIRSEETRGKIAAAKIGTKLSEGTKEKLRNKTTSAGTRKKMAAAKIGCELSPEHRNKVANVNKRPIPVEWDGFVFKSKRALARHLRVSPTKVDKLLTRREVKW